MLALFARMALSLAVVLLLLWGATRLLQRGTRRGSGQVIEVLARTPLSRNASVAVVRVADRALILGCTDQRVQLLGETDPAEVRPPRPVQRTPVHLAATRLPMPGVDSAARPGTESPLTGSVLSPTTWRQTIHVLREKSVRRA